MTTLALILAMLLALAPANTAAANAVPVLMYHSVTDSMPPGDTVVSPAQFAAQMQHLARHRYQTLSMDELVEVMRGRRPVPARAVVLTFDDGLRKVLPAIPILEQHGFKASFWIITGADHDPDYLNWREIKDLARNPRYEFQSHTKTHPWRPGNTMLDWAQGKTPGKSMADVRAELVESKRELEARLGRPVHYLAWPMGVFNDAMVEVAKDSGYKALLTTDDGPGNVPGADVLRIRRVGINGLCSLADFIAQLADHRDRESC